jgi:hypothetical protein
MKTFEPSYTRAGRTLYRLEPETLRSHDAHRYEDHETMGGAGVSDERAGLT